MTSVRHLTPVPAAGDHDGVRRGEATPFPALFERIVKALPGASLEVDKDDFGQDLIYAYVDDLADAAIGALSSVLAGAETNRLAVERVWDRHRAMIGADGRHYCAHCSALLRPTVTGVVVAWPCETIKDVRGPTP